MVASEHETIMQIWINAQAKNLEEANNRIIKKQIIK